MLFYSTLGWRATAWAAVAGRNDFSGLAIHAQQKPDTKVPGLLFSPGLNLLDTVHSGDPPPSFPGERNKTSVILLRSFRKGIELNHN